MKLEKKITQRAVCWRHLSHSRRFSAFIGGYILFFWLLSSVVCRSAPSWWSTRGVVGTNMPVADYSPVIMGQLKWMATNACDELDAYFPGGAGTNVQNLVRGFSNSNNWLTVNEGQIKAVATPFYDRLIEEGYTNAYPWTGVSITNDYALANLGQLKNVFSFDPITLDTDADGLYDYWERTIFGDLSQDASGDADGDGFTNIQEQNAGSNPNIADTDGDGVRDGNDLHPTTNVDSDSDGLSDDWEMANFENLNQTAGGDMDGDGVSNLDEFRNGTDPTKVNVSDGGNTTGLTVFTPVE